MALKLILEYYTEDPYRSGKKDLTNDKKPPHVSDNNLTCPLVFFSIKSLIFKLYSGCYRFFATFEYGLVVYVCQISGLPSFFVRSGDEIQTHKQKLSGKSRKPSRAD